MKCDFCDREETMIRYKGKGICRQCAFAITGFYRNDDVVKENAEDIMTPMKLYERISRYVIGQDEAKKVLCVAAYTHQLRTRGVVSGNVGKSNILLLGPTGSGKTYMVKTLAKSLGVPFVTVSAASLTETGYEGESVSGAIQRLYAVAGGDIAAAERGIIFIDEIDKLCVRGTSPKTVGVTGVQQELLTVLEGTEVDVGQSFMTVGISTGGSQRVIDTSKILFICGGAFPDLEDIIASRMNFGSRIGFGDDALNQVDSPDDLLSMTTDADLKKFGMIPELIGRLPVKCALRPLGIDDLKNILCSAKGSVIEQFRELFAVCGVKLVIKEDAVMEIAKKAKESGTGARALRGVVEELLHEFLFTIPGNTDIEKLIVTSKFVRGEEEITTVRKKKVAKAGV